MKHETATGLSLFFSLWCYGKKKKSYSSHNIKNIVLTWKLVTPIGGAIVADQYLGKYKTIVVFAAIYIAGLLILLLTSLPSSLNNGAGLGGFIASILIIGIGTGGIKANVSPLIADQYTRKRMAIKTLKSGERVIIDPGT
jgi:POT family proton-dependent oligopeptide transporter